MQYYLVVINSCGRYNIENLLGASEVRTYRHATQALSYVLKVILVTFAITGGFGGSVV